MTAAVGESDKGMHIPTAAKSNYHAQVVSAPGEAGRHHYQKYRQRLVDHSIQSMVHVMLSQVINFNSRCCHSRTIWT